MNSVRQALFVLAMCVGAAVFSLPTRAAIVQYSDQFGPQSYNFSVYDEGTTIERDVRTASLVFPRFDPSMGTLESVMIEFSSVADASVLGFQSNASSTNAVNANMRVAYSLSAPGISATNNDIFFNRTVSNSNPVFQIDYGQQSHVTVFDSTTTNLSSYIGAGNISAQLRMEFAQNAFSSSSSLDYQFTADTTTVATITYQTTAIPEPSALGILGLLTCSLCLQRSRQKQAGR